MRNKPVADAWGWSERITAAVIIAAALLLLYGLAHAEAAPALGQGAGDCYGANYPATVTAFTGLGLPGWYWVTVDTDAGSYTLATTRLFRTGQARTLQGLVCGRAFSPSRVK